MDIPRKLHLKETSGVWLGELMLKPGILVQAICLHITDLAMYPVSGGFRSGGFFWLILKWNKMRQNEKKWEKMRKTKGIHEHIHHHHHHHHHHHSMTVGNLFIL